MRKEVRGGVVLSLEKNSYAQRKYYGRDKETNWIPNLRGDKKYLWGVMSRPIRSPMVAGSRVRNFEDLKLNVPVCFYKTGKGRSCIQSAGKNFESPLGKPLRGPISTGGDGFGNHEKQKKRKKGGKKRERV